MKISNETKVGVLAVVAIALLILGFNFLKGESLFRKPDVIYAVFNDIGPLDRSNAVRINGLQVGTVYELVPMDNEVNRIIATIHLSRELNIPTNSVAFIDAGLLGSAFINIEKGPATSFLKPGDTISTRLNPGIISDLKSQLTPTIERVNTAVDTLTEVLGGINSVLDDRTTANIRTMLANLALTSAELQQVMNAQSGAISRSISNLESFSGNLAGNNEKITSTLGNLETTSNKLANARIDETMASLEATVNDLRAVVNRLQSNDGSLGLLMTDRELYDNLNGAALRIQVLLDDIRYNPKRYVNFSIIGRKDRGSPITSPAVIDTSSSRN